VVNVAEGGVKLHGALSRHLWLEGAFLLTLALQPQLFFFTLLVTPALPRKRSLIQVATLARGGGSCPGGDIIGPCAAVQLRPEGIVGLALLLNLPHPLQCTVI
jgi:hypothetical protein